MPSPCHWAGKSARSRKAPPSFSTPRETFKRAAPTYPVVALVLDWKKKLGYTRDPFEPAPPSPASRYAVGFEDVQERFNLFLIKHERLATLSGEPGTGKTLFLAWAQEQLKAGYKTHAIDAERHGTADALRDAVLSGSVSLLARALRNPLRKGADEKRALLLKNLSAGKQILLIDNAGALSPEALALLKEIMDATQTHIVLADTKERLERGQPRGAHLALKTPAYTHAQLASILERRIAGAGGSGTFPFDGEQLAALVRKADGNPARLLALARERAIELSLKVATPPKGQAPVPRADAPPAPDRKVGGFLSIRIERGPDVRKDGPMASAAAPLEEALARGDDPQPMSGDSAADADALMHIVDGAAAPDAPGKPEPKRAQEDTKEYERAIRKLAGELGSAKPKKAAQKRATKKK